MSQEQKVELTEVEQTAMNKIAGLKQYEVYASELVYYAKKVWAVDEEDARRKANEEGFSNQEIYDGHDFEMHEVEEVDEEN
jgi:hypothetical protein